MHEKEAKRAWRARRSFAFKKNIGKYGLLWAKVIAVKIRMNVDRKRVRDLKKK